MGFNVDALLLHPSFPQIAEGIEWFIPERKLDYDLVNELVAACEKHGRGSDQAKAIRAELGIEEPRRVVKTGQPRMPVNVSPLEVRLLQLLRDGDQFNTDDFMRAGFSHKSAQERIRYLWNRGMVDRVSRMKNGSFIYQINDKGIHFLVEKEVQ